mmetsp:Transcript_53095/g.128585  ORF Transcript_53095/g.128585 Transcript_53095/m.128585 type:complete len:220 (+) Transcript_53095:222-881(+)
MAAVWAARGRKPGGPARGGVGRDGGRVLHRRQLPHGLHPLHVFLDNHAVQLLVEGKLPGGVGDVVVCERLVPVGHDPPCDSGHCIVLHQRLIGLLLLLQQRLRLGSRRDLDSNLHWWGDVRHNSLVLPSHLTRRRWCFVHCPRILVEGRACHTRPDEPVCIPRLPCPAPGYTSWRWAYTSILAFPIREVGRHRWLAVRRQPCVPPACHAGLWRWGGRAQ